MSLQERLGPASWELLRNAPLTISIGVCVVDTIAGSHRKEARAFDEALADGAKRFSHNKLVKAVVANAKKPTSRQQRGVCSAPRAELLRKLRRVAAVLDKRIDKYDAEEFIVFLLEIGWTVARASSESPFGGCKVSMEEESFLYDADSALHATDAAADDADLA